MAICAGVLRVPDRDVELHQPSPTQRPPQGPHAFRRLTWRLAAWRGQLGRWLRLAYYAADYTRQAGLRAGVGRAAAVVRHGLPVIGRAAWRRLWPPGDAYRAWRQAHEPGPRALAEQRRAQACLGYRPLISLITVVEGAAPQALQGTLNSIRGQTYEHWEWCVVYAIDSDPGVTQLLTSAAASDPRCAIHPLPRGLGRSGNLNAAVARAGGDFVLVVDAGDRLAPQLLYSLAGALNQQAALDVVYFDEDRLSEDGRARHDPWFKPARWSPALMLSTNVLAQALMRRALVAALGGFDSAVDGAEAWDLALRLTERTQRLAHLPLVGYHRRLEPRAAAGPAALAAQQRCLLAHLARSGQPQAAIARTQTGRMRVRWPVEARRVSIIIPTRDQLPLLRACLEAIFEQTAQPAYEVVLVDTGSADPETWLYYQALSEAGRPVQLVRLGGEFNYAAANNRGAEAAHGDVLVFLNNDTECLDAHWLEELAGWAVQPGVGLVGAKLLRPDGKIQHAGMVLGLAGHGSHIFEGSSEGSVGPFGSPDWYRDVLAVTAACLAVRRTLFEALGGFDEAYQLGYSDLELGLRAVSRGWRVVYTPFARLRRHEGATRGWHSTPADVLRAYWQMRCVAAAGDPYFSPHLSSASRGPRVARPGELPREKRLEAILADHELVYRPIPNLQSPWPEAMGQRQHFGAAATAAKAPAGRLLLVAHNLGLTGAPQMLAQAAAMLREADYSVSLVAPADGPQRQSLTQLGVEVWIEPRVLHDARVLARHLEGCDLVVANTILAWRAVMAARAAHVPCLWWVQEVGFGQALARREAGVAWALAAADPVVFVSAAQARLYADWVPPERVVVVHNGIDAPDSRLEAPHAAAGPAGSLLVVNLASVEPNKGQAVLMRAVARLPEALRSRTRVLVVGQPLHQAYHRLVQSLAAREAGRVRLLGLRPRPEALGVLRQAHVFVLPSRSEALSVALLEAMALGKAILATRVGGIMEAVRDGQEALLVPPDDPAALAAALARLLEDADLRARLGSAARARFEASFTRAHFTAAYLEQVRAMVAARADRQARGHLGAREGPGELPSAYRVPVDAVLSAEGPALEQAPFSVCQA